MEIKKTFISENQPAVLNGLWLKPVGDAFMVYVIERGYAKVLKLADDQGTSTPSDDKVKRDLRVTNITALTSAQCGALNIGDHVIKITGKMNHLYTVTYKEDKQGMCLSYVDAENAETVAYDYNNTTKKWEYTDTTITPLV